MKVKAFWSTRAALCVVVLVLAMVTAACRTGEGRPGSAAAPAAAETSGAHSGHAAAGTGVQMRLVKFRPALLEVPAGTEVTWTQADAGFHTVTSGTAERGDSGATAALDGSFRSERLSTGQTFKFRFDEAGTYSYFCEIHPATMTGEVRVGA